MAATLDCNDGALWLNDGALRLNDGALRLNDGTLWLKNGALRLNDGALWLNDGALRPNDGELLLKNGALRAKPNMLTSFVYFVLQILYKIFPLVVTNVFIIFSFCFFYRKLKNIYMFSLIENENGLQQLTLYYVTSLCEVRPHSVRPTLFCEDGLILIPISCLLFSK